MSHFPDAGTYARNLSTGEFIEAQEDFLASTRQLPGAAARSVLTMLNDGITPVSALHTVDTENQGSSDTLRYIATGGVPDGMELRLRAESASRAVTVVHSAETYGIRLADGKNRALSPLYYLCLKRNGNVWEEVAGDAVMGLDGKTLSGNAEGKSQAVDVLLASGKTAKEMGQIGPAANNPAGITSMDQLVEEGLYCFTTGVPADFPVGNNGFVRVITGGNGYVKQFAFRMGTPGSNDFDAACRTLAVNASGAVVSAGPWWKLGTIKFAVYSAASGTVDAYAVNISSLSVVATGQYRLRLVHPVPSTSFAPLVTTPGNVGGFGVANRVDTEGYTWDVHTYNGIGVATNRLFRAVSL